MWVFMPGGCLFDNHFSLAEPHWGHRQCHEDLPKLLHCMEAVWGAPRILQHSSGIHSGEARGLPSSAR